MVADGQSVLLDIGTTAYRLARQLHGRRLTVITSNLVVYEELADDEGIELVLLGGMVRREYRSLVGFLTEDNLRQLHADWLFLGTSGVRPGGQVMDTTVVEVPVKRAMIKAGDKVVLLADSAKFPGHRNGEGLRSRGPGRGGDGHAGRPGDPVLLRGGGRRGGRGRKGASVKLTILGGGGFRVPLVYGALLGDRGEGRVTEVVLHDLDAGRLHRGRPGAGRAGGRPSPTPPAVTATTDLDEALRGADFVFSAIRVGGLEGRAADERVALAEGVLGQETVGAGGIAYGLRTVPVAVDIARRVARARPRRLGHQLHQPGGPGHRGDVPAPRRPGHRHLRLAGRPRPPRRRASLGADPDAGLDRLRRPQPPRLAARPARRRPRRAARACSPTPTLLGSFEEGRLFGADWLRSLGAVPNEYLHYYYFNRESRAAPTSEAEQTRGAFLRDQQAALLRAS